MKIKLFKNKLLFDKLNKEVGRNKFRVFEGKENVIFPHAKRGSRFLVATTGSSIESQEVALECEGFDLRGYQGVIIIKHWRPDSPHKNVAYHHLNVDVQVLIPTKNKEIVKLEIDSDKKEHVIEDKNIVSFLGSTYWPCQKSGSIGELYRKCNFPTVKLKPVSERT